ncbi:MAG: TetR/AcrR family transcriptional regulator [Gluconacetobacter diazotrophicus]|nr:TetR/AcrR family transcriptional regulator [Gluconacetobacter diazotrophicus]
MGRHREFDSSEALSAALHVFWRKGFEGTSLTDLTEAMGINRPSLYAAFGNKEDLFRKALDQYMRTCIGFFEAALDRPTAREAAEAVLLGYADAQTDTANPPGCLVTHGALACSEASEPIRQELLRLRVLAEDRVRERLERATREGDLPADADPADLASYVMTVKQGMAVQAASGADRATLHAVVRNAMRAWPGQG